MPDASQRRAFSPRPPESWLIQPDRTSQLASTEANRPNDRALASKLANNVNIYFERRSSSAQILSEEAPLNQTAQALGNVDRKPEPVATSYSRSEPSALWEHSGLEQSSNEHADSIDDGKPGIGASRINDLNSRAEVTAAIALANADAVDREARFPIEAIQSARDQRLLGMMVPVALERRRQHLRRGRRMLHNRARLLLERDDLCDASDHGRDSDAACSEKPLAQCA